VIDEKRLAEIEERADAATKGPWEMIPDTMFRDNALRPSTIKALGREVFVAKTLSILSNGRGRMLGDAAFIAAARSDVPDLVAEVRRLRAWLKWMAYNEFSQDAARALRGDSGPDFMDDWDAPADVSVVNWDDDNAAIRGEPAP
jgi:hypothetical protein